MLSLICWELLDEYQLWWCNVEESFCRVIKIPWSKSHCHRLNHDDEPECKNKKIFPCSVNAETQDVLSSQRCEAEEESVVVLDSRYYSFTQPTIMETHFSTVVVKFCESWCKEVGDNGKKKGKRFQHTSWLFFGSNSTEANERSVLILDEETEDGVEIEILER